MQQEIEAKFLDTPHDKLRVRLQQLGAVRMYPARTMRRRNFDFPDKRLDAKTAWVRLRDEGDKVELMLKQSLGSAIGDIRETPVIVSDFEGATEFLLSIGLYEKSEQETRRELWMLGDTEIMLDEWPWVKPFIEVEAGSEESVRQTAEKLGLNWSEAVFDTIEPVYYAEYDVTREQIHAITSISFSKPVPQVLAERKK